jgi:hypothetical protein
VPPGDLKEPPKWMSKSQRAGWRYVIRNTPPGLLKKLDRGLLAQWVSAEDWHRIAELARADPELDPQAAALYATISERAGKLMVAIEADRRGRSDRGSRSPRAHALNHEFQSVSLLSYFLSFLYRWLCTLCTLPTIVIDL